MASVTYGKCYLWQKYYGKCNYGKSIMANETEPQKLFLAKFSVYLTIFRAYSCFISILDQKNKKYIVT